MRTVRAHIGSPHCIPHIKHFACTPHVTCLTPSFALHRQISHERRQRLSSNSPLSRCQPSVLSFKFTILCPTPRCFRPLGKTVHIILYQSHLAAHLRTYLTCKKFSPSATPTCERNQGTSVYPSKNVVSFPHISPTPNFAPWS